MRNKLFLFPFNAFELMQNKKKWADGQETGVKEKNYSDTC